MNYRTKIIMKTKILTAALMAFSFSSLAQDQYINGNLAIGASNRTDIGTLHVTSSDTSILPVIRIESSTNSDLSYIRFQAKNSSSANKYADILFDPNTGNLAFKTPYNSTEKMTIKSNGNVGIGTVSPTAKLDVNGEIVSRSNYLTISPSANDAVIRRGTTGNLMLCSNSGTSSIYLNYAYGSGSGGVRIYDEELLITGI